MMQWLFVVRVHRYGLPSCSFPRPDPEVTVTTHRSRRSRCRVAATGPRAPPGSHNNRGHCRPRGSRTQTLSCPAEGGRCGCFALVLPLDRALVFQSDTEFPSRLVGIDRSQEVQAFWTFWLKGMMQQHSVVDRVPYWDSVPSPEAVDVKEAVLEHLFYGVVKDSSDPLPGVEFGSEGRPVIPISSTIIFERYHESHSWVGSKSDTGNPLSTSFNINGQSF